MTNDEKRAMAKRLSSECPEALEMLKAVSKVFGPLDHVEIKTRENDAIQDNKRGGAE